MLVNKLLCQFYQQQNYVITIYKNKINDTFVYDKIMHVQCNFFSFASLKMGYLRKANLINYIVALAN